MRVKRDVSAMNLADIPILRTLCFAVTDRLAVPSVRLHIIGNKAFLVAAPKVCNSSPDDIISSASCCIFAAYWSFLFRLVPVTDIFLVHNL